MSDLHNAKNAPKKRLPPGQHLTNSFPVLQYGDVIALDPSKYHLILEGDVKTPQDWTFEQLKSLPQAKKTVDIHCVTSWSKFDTEWSGIEFNTILKLVNPNPTAKFVEFVCADNGFTTSVPIEALSHPESLLALAYDGKPIENKHGGPIRPIFSHLYFYKSAKWVEKMIFLKEDRLGYWEKGGYSNKADPWKNQRYRRDD